jgi:hypothetical protein
MSSEDEDDWRSSVCEEDDCDGEDEHIFETEYGASERVGFTGLAGAAPKTRLERAEQDPYEKFSQSVDAISRHLRNEADIIITEDDIEKMIFKAANLDVVEHKNPSAYVLGFLATGGGSKLTDDLFHKTINKVLPHVDVDASVFPHDVIRYARLWQKLSLKSS